MTMARPRGWTRRSSARRSTLLAGAPDRRARRRDAGRRAASRPTLVLAARARTASSALRHERVDRDPFESRALPRDGRRVVRARTLTDEQATALERLRRARGRAARFTSALLHGVTGSGKTEIYLRLAARRPRRRPPGADARAGDRADAGRRGARSAQRVRRARGHPAQRPVRRRAPRPVAAHPARRDRRRRRHAVGGVRAARPARPRSSWTRSTTRRTSRRRARATTAATSRSCARKRAGALVVLGSATPSLESYHNAMSGPVRARRRSSGACSTARWPPSRVVDMREEYAAGGPDVVLSRALRDGDRGAARAAASRRSCC